MCNIPAFGEKTCIQNQENRHNRVFHIADADDRSFDDYCALFEGVAYVKKEEYRTPIHRFAALSKGKQGVFINYYSFIRELRIVIEDFCRYFSYVDTCKNLSVSPQITQIMLEDFGMSYAIRLSDGRFVVIDGGYNFEPDRDRLFCCLKNESPESKPIIAAWIMSHPHIDHYQCFIGFVDRYADEVLIEKVMLNFPEADDLEHYPDLSYKDARFTDDVSEITNIPRMLERIKRTGAQSNTLHTGQRYRIGDADCEVLSCMDDTIHVSKNINATSLVIRMCLGGQTILWTTDAGFSYARLPERYGSYLKADILQVPHHGFQCGEASSEIRGYDLIKPQVCLLPVSDYSAYTFFCSYREGTRYLMNAANVKEIITGSTQRTITLPYTADDHVRREMKEKCARGERDNGARTWVYTGLSTSCKEDFSFTLLNMTALPATVDIELFFEAKECAIRFIKAEIPASSLRTLCIIGEEADGDALFFNGDSLKRKGIPEDVPFAVRFLCDKPMVVSHRHHAASYASMTF